MLQALSDFIHRVTHGETLDVAGQKARWQKVAELIPGMMIAVPAACEEGAGVEWDEIVSIRRLASEQVYDIEVAGTHNFVANRIFAHNTVGKALFTLNETGDQNILTASASGSTQATIGRTGIMTAAQFQDQADTTYFLDPAASGTGLKLNGDIELTGGGTISSTANNNITIDAGSGTVCIGVAGTCAGKLDSGTLDPPYTINGKKYATYVPSMVGIKEETTGTVETKLSAISYQPSAIIDFKNQPEGSDLWLFSKVTALKKHIGQMTVLLSPASNTRSWYTVDPESMRLTIFTSAPTTVSYRLSAPRFDSDQWKNTREEGSIGHVINDPDEPPVTTDGQGYLSGISLSLVKESDGQGGSIWKLKDNLGSTIEEFLTASQATIATITAGSANIRELVAGSIDVGNLTIGGKPLSEYIREIIETSAIRRQPSDILSPIASDSAGLSVNLGDSQFFRILNRNGTPSASLDSLGNATFSGKLSVSEVRSREVTTNQLTTSDATVAGTLYADRIMTRFGEIGNIQTSTIAATYITNNVTNVTQLIASDSAAPTPATIATEELLDLIARVRDRARPQATDSSAIDATSSALLALIQNTALDQMDKFVQFDQPVTITNTLSVSGQLLASGPLLVGTDGISATSDTLYIEKGKTANLDIMNGTIVVNTLGDVIITGNLAISGNVAIGGVLGVSRLSPTNGELTIDLTRYGGTGTESSELVDRFGRFLIEREGKTVASITASGSATFAGNLVASGSGTFSKLMITGYAPTSDQASTPSAGTAILQAGATQVTIPNTLVTGQSLIYVTPISSTTNQVLYIYKKRDGESFTVAVDAPIPTDVTFNWWIIN